MPSSFLDVCRFIPTAGGTTDWTYSSAVTGYQGPAAAGAVNAAIYSYRAESNDLSQWEMGVGAYNSGTTVFARTTVLFNSLGTTAKINFTTVPQVAIVALGEDWPSLVNNNSFAGKQNITNTTEATGVGTTAAALIAGGLEIAKKLFVTGLARFSAATFNYSGAPNGTCIDARDFTLANNTAVFTQTERNVSSVSDDTVVTINSVSGTGIDAGATRAVMRNFGTANSYPASTKGANIRALEGHSLVDSSIPNDVSRITWAMELGLHSQLAGDGVNKNIGIYLASSHTGWLSSGVRNDSALFITGEDGWTHGIRYVDTDGSTVLFDVDQLGTVLGRAMKPTASPQAAWGMDCSACTIAVAAGGNAVLADGAGLIIVTDGSISGHTCLYLTGGSTVVISSQIGTDFVAPTTTPAAGKYSIQFNGTHYAIYNGAASTVTFSIAMIRSRASL